MPACIFYLILRSGPRGHSHPLSVPTPVWSISADGLVCLMDSHGPTCSTEGRAYLTSLQVKRSIGPPWGCPARPAVPACLPQALCMHQVPQLEHRAAWWEAESRDTWFMLLGSRSCGFKSCWGVTISPWEWQLVLWPPLVTLIRRPPYGLWVMQ